LLGACGLAFTATAVSAVAGRIHVGAWVMLTEILR